MDQEKNKSQTHPIRLLRTQYLRLTQAQMAEQLGLSLRTYCRHEVRGPSAPVWRLAKTLTPAVTTPPSAPPPGQSPGSKSHPGR